jgi:integrase
MPRALKDSRLNTREARAKLKPRGKPYWFLLGNGIHLGYRKLKGRPGSWTVRRYLGKQSKQTYTMESLDAVADDNWTANGHDVLTFAQAQKRALERRPKLPGAWTVGDAVDSYLTHLRDSGKATAADAHYRVNAYILPPLGETPLADLTAKQLRDWLGALARAPHRRKNGESSGDDARRRRKVSANRVFIILRAALSLAFRDGHVSSDQAWRAVRPFQGVNTARVRWLAVAEAQRLVNACPPDFRRLVQGALATGARYGELTRLQAHDFDSDAGTLAVRRSKSGKPRHIPLTAEGKALFANWTAGLAGDALIFTHADGSPWGKGHQREPIIDACARASISPPIGFHGMRHTFASLAVMNGAPLIAVAAALGHRDTRMCELHYAHLSKNYLGDAIRSAAPKFGFEIDDTVVPMGRKS